MVDAINGSGKTIIITTKPKAKVDKSSSFDDTLKTKTSGTSKSSSSANQPIMMRSNMENNMRIIQQQQLQRMEHIQEITRQIQEGTYKMCDPQVLAEKIFQVVSDKTTREKFIKKLLKEEAEKLPAKNNGKITELEMKKLVFMIKESQDEPFDDPELEELLKEFS
ncbi:MAG: flagellar biosynthesis anti-sigma factor FlgM [Candidatus Riflebacteria bacterium]|nr:flagellar biosynthesis anti-sigma factor FlgM [Candidatus Riflebacteria bacterium]